MTTFIPRGPYTREELETLYPGNLKLQLVQVLLRHGERSPVSARFQNAGLIPFWPYCSIARNLVSSAMDDKGSSWGTLEWRRRLETFGPGDGPIIAAGPRGEVDGVCNLGELTDRGRETTRALGGRLRHLYVDQLHFMPPTISNTDMIYLRATPIPRALESLQETFLGMYPSNSRAATFPPPTIITRGPADETLFPNDGGCRRFAQLSRAFAQRTADKWNHTTEMDYLNKLISKWMPDNSKMVAVDSHPRLSGIMDTINSTFAHGPETRLPKEFYDRKGRDIIEAIGVEEWFSGYKESQEYRALGIGSLMGDVVSRMVGSIGNDVNDELKEGGENVTVGYGRGGETAIKLGLSGCHDTTLAAVLASLGAFETSKWPPYTSHIALELFRKAESASQPANHKIQFIEADLRTTNDDVKVSKSWLERVFGIAKPNENAPATSPSSIARRTIEKLTDAEIAKLDGYYVRVRYNDTPMTIPGCKLPGKHLEGDESFCTLEAFKAIVDKFTPANWKKGCWSNLDAPVFPETVQPAGY